VAESDEDKKEGEGRPDDYLPGRTGKLPELPRDLEGTLRIAARKRKRDKRHNVPFPVSAGGFGDKLRITGIRSLPSYSSVISVPAV
jgi:hypothetical protein